MHAHLSAFELLSKEVLLQHMFWEGCCFNTGGNCNGGLLQEPPCTREGSWRGWVRSRARCGDTASANPHVPVLVPGHGHGGTTAMPSRSLRSLAPILCPNSGQFLGETNFQELKPSTRTRLFIPNLGLSHFWPRQISQKTALPVVFQHSLFSGGAI